MMSTSTQDSSTREWRNYTFLRSVRCSPSLPVQIIMGPVIELYRPVESVVAGSPTVEESNHKTEGRRPKDRSVDKGD